MLLADHRHFQPVSPTSDSSGTDEAKGRQDGMLVVVLEKLRWQLRLDVCCGEQVFGTVVKTTSSKTSTADQLHSATLGIGCNPLCL